MWHWRKTLRWVWCVKKIFSELSNNRVITVKYTIKNAINLTFNTDTFGKTTNRMFTLDMHNIIIQFLIQHYTKYVFCKRVLQLSGKHIVWYVIYSGIHSHIKLELAMQFISENNLKTIHRTIDHTRLDMYGEWQGVFISSLLKLVVFWNKTRPCVANYTC